VNFSCKLPSPAISNTAHAGDPSLAPKENVKFLGVWIDSNLNWKEHVRGLVPKLNSACYALKQMCFLTEMETLLLIYNSYFQSHLQYGIIFWGNSTDSHKIFKIQKRALRIMSHTSNLNSCRPIFQQLKILPLFSLYIYELVRFCKKNHSMFVPNNQFHNYTTRHGLDLRFPKHRTSLLEKGVLYASIKYFNVLPAELRNEPSYSRFSLRLKDILINNVVYNEVEFMNIFAPKS
jgi:hypothetical protein